MKSIQSNIVLIGMPGAGKSTAGVLLAKTLGMPFIDTDLLIQQQEGMLLQDIIDRRGLQSFMEAEERVLLALAVENHVIATGGSAVFSTPGMAHLKKHGKLYYLKLPYEQIQTRVQNVTTRGIAMDKGQTLFDVYAGRTPLYEKYADCTLDCAGMDSEAMVRAVAEAYHGMRLK